MNTFRGSTAAGKIKTIAKTAGVVFAFLSMSIFNGCFLFTPDGKEDEVTISQPSVQVTVGESVTLTASSSEGRAIVWTSSDEDIAEVTNGVVTGISKGIANITANDGKKMAFCEVTVVNDESFKDGYKLVWRDEFDGTSLDLTKWSYQTGTKDTYGEGGPEGWGNNELQYYSENNVTLSGGNLMITAKRESTGGKKFTSGRITSRGKYTTTYGYIEARIKMPAGKGMWPAFWMLPQPTDTSSSHNVYGGWPANGEIDILEAQGLKPEKCCGTVHYGGKSDYRYSSKEYTFTNSSITEWHTYAVEWTDKYIKWFIDGEPYSTVTCDKYYSVASDSKSAPFDQPFYILLNLAVDSGKFDPDSTGGPEESFTEASMYIDYVRVYEILN